ncbi:MAG TPA: YibE/F family protein [Anaerolineales bacterium]|nr:YibE/F family protein [Anaerolineae bacterium]HIQ00849.1 YibE/F family protein [Anaerolineales bacterium]
MQKLERWLAVGLGGLILLTVALLVAGPLLERRAAPVGEELAPGETETMAACVVEVVEEGTVDLGGGYTQPYQQLLLRVESGSLAGQEVLVEEGMVNVVGRERRFRPGDRVYLARAVGPAEDRLYISDYRRTGPLFWILALFMGLVVLVGRGKGLRSLAGTLFSLAVIFAFVVPQIIAGRDPVAVSIAGSILLLAVSTYLIYGWNPKAHAALMGMALSLALTGVLAGLFVGWARLSGLAAEESGYLVMELGSGISLRGLLLGGIIIGSLGVLDDICVGQASAVFELVNANRDLGWVDLFRRSLNIGRDHIAAMVNTLLLAYVGASMPLMLVFTLYQESLVRRLNREPIAEEIVRTLVGSVGLVLAVPVTSLIASLLARWAVRRGEAGKQGSRGAEEQGSGG